MPFHQSIYSTIPKQPLVEVNQSDIHAQLKSSGWAFLRGYEADVTTFSALINKLCDRLTFDPAREFGDKRSQKVNAGTAAIGLHIENGNTPFPPDIIAFYSQKSATQGSQTTVCDGHDIYNAMSPEMREKFAQPITVKRNLPSDMWRRYIANEHPSINDINDVEPIHLQQILASLSNHRGQLKSDDSLDYELDIHPIINGYYSPNLSFANAILGPSLNYEPPRYYFADGQHLCNALMCDIAAIAEQYTVEIPWQDGDVAIIDNKRVMHGRREITHVEQRELFICMGLNDD